MKKWIVCMALAVCGCGGDSFLGTWKGSVSGWDVTVKVDKQQVVSSSSGAVSGLVSTNKAACFTNAIMHGTIAETTVDIGSVGSGSASSGTIIKIQGEFIGDTLLGFFTAVSANSECSVDRSPITLTR